MHICNLLKYVAIATLFIDKIIRLNSFQTWYIFYDEYLWTNSHPAVFLIRFMSLWTYVLNNIFVKLTKNAQNTLSMGFNSRTEILLPYLEILLINKTGSASSWEINYINLIRTKLWDKWSISTINGKIISWIQ